ncbi:hypothetical protein FCM35_KLT14284 [Carex littledalei]|uniref:Uncharacterized protein n=1 Tax=Carex littledalei TaxID=544730 RepID=A0A833QEF3_9POAL|nr:hypothetical protein FCM35_KLT14284 [Carex littledalei]
MDARKGMEEGGIGGEQSNCLDREVGEPGMGLPTRHEEKSVGRGRERVGEARRGVDGGGEDGETD